MNELHVFQNNEFGSIRTIEKNDGVWFVAKDVADALGYEASRNAVARFVDYEDKLTHQISASGQMREMTIINESGLYSLVLSSKLESAKKFKRWVTSEVLPAIRKTGTYQKQLSPLEILAAQAQALVEQERRTSALEKEVQDMREIIQLSPNNWREETTKLLNKVSYKLNDGIAGVDRLRKESYELLEERMKVNLKVRLTNKRRRMADEGICNSKRNKLNYLDVIADDSKLIEGYVAIVKEMAIKYGVSDKGGAAQ